jgi:phosphohistidine phosphatase SixA
MEFPFRGALNHYYYRVKQMLRRRLLLIGIIWVGVGQNLFAVTNPNSIRDKLNEINANVLLMRHALAPGFGDPEKFVINQCTTQRNLDDVGRDQAKSLGLKLKQEGLIFDKIYSSYWCRCLETAQLLNLGAVDSFAGLNSFFQGHVERTQTLQLLQKKFVGLDQNSLTLMVTHQVVIQAVTGISVSSGDLVAYNSKTGKSVRISIE